MAVPLDVVVVSSCTFRYHFAVFVCCGINDIVRTSDKLHASHINGIRPCRQRHIGRCGDSEANLVQLGALGPAHRAVLVISSWVQGVSQIHSASSELQISQT